MRIHADFDGGRIDVVSTSRRGAELAIPEDPGGVRQWFAFRVEGARGRALELAIVNASACTYADALEGYRVCASHDGERWFRVPTRFDGETLAIAHAPRRDAITYAYFATYPEARRARLLTEMADVPWARVERIGESLLGRGLDVVVLGEDDAPRRGWIVCRQHSGETMAEWFAEGLLGALADPDNPATRALLPEMQLRVVTCANPDGAALGHQRANAAGVDPNRQWIDPGDDAPEIAAIRAAMEATSVDAFLDVHGDERTPYCFLAGCEGNPSWDDRLRALEGAFEAALLEASPDFQDEEGYPRDAPGDGDLRTASNFVGERFGCLSFTLEMPYEDAANHPDARRGWTPERSKALGAAVVEALARVVG